MAQFCQCSVQNCAEKIMAQFCTEHWLRWIEIAEKSSGGFRGCNFTRGRALRLGGAGTSLLPQVCDGVPKFCACVVLSLGLRRLGFESAAIFCDPFLLGIPLPWRSCHGVSPHFPGPAL